jgi:DNA (cytosine-5)-methyltransferase 1
MVQKPTNRTPTPRTVAEFFAGIGLVRMGLEKDGWSVVFANDIAEDKQQLYNGHFHDSPSHFLREDIHTLDVRKIPDATLATASFPCTDLSLAGMRRGLNGKHSSAFWGFVRVLEELGSRRPPFVLLENVAGFLTSHEGKDFQAALLALNRLGYSVDAFTLDAVRFVPQSRVRLFVVGSLCNEQGSREAQETPSFYESVLRPKALADFIFHHPEIAWRIRPLPAPPQKAPIQLRTILETVPDDSSVWWNKKRTDYLVSQMSDKHSAVLREMMQKKDWSYGTVFRRVRNGKTRAELRTDGIAGCLRTPKGGSAKQILIQAGYKRVKARLLTPRECARLMGADDFELTGIPLDQALFGFGDAVCVPAITWIAKNYLDPLADELAQDCFAPENEEYQCKETKHWKTDSANSKNKPLLRGKAPSLSS